MLHYRGSVSRWINRTVQRNVNRPASTSSYFRIHSLLVIVWDKLRVLGVNRIVRQLFARGVNDFWNFLMESFSLDELVCSLRSQWSAFPPRAPPGHNLWRFRWVQSTAPSLALRNLPLLKFTTEQNPIQCSYCSASRGCHKHATKHHAVPPWEYAVLEGAFQGRQNGGWILPGRKADLCHILIPSQANDIPGCSDLGQLSQVAP